MKTILVGPGSVGGTAAVLMKEAGYDISVVCVNDEVASKISTEGYKLTGAKGDHCVKIPAFGSIDQLTEKYDICIIATKVHSMPILAEKMLPHIKDDALVVCMQNGIVTERLSAVVGAHRTVSVMIGFGATAKSLTEVEMTSTGEFYIGMPKGQSSPKLEYLRKMYDSILPTKISSDITRELFSKLIINSCINATCGIAGNTLGIVLDDPRAREVFINIATEGFYVSRAMGLKVPPYNGILDYRFLLISKSNAYKSLVKAVFRAFGKLKYSSVKPSLLQSLERGEKTEIDIFNGYISEKGKQYNVATPYNDLIVKLIREIENGEREISMDNLKEFDCLAK